MFVADELYIRLIYQRFKRLLAIAGTSDQVRPVRAARCGATAANDWVGAGDA